MEKHYFDVGGVGDSGGGGVSSVWWEGVCYLGSSILLGCVLSHLKWLTGVCCVCLLFLYRMVQTGTKGLFVGSFVSYRYHGKMSAAVTENNPVDVAAYIRQEERGGAMRTSAQNVELTSTFVKETLFRQLKFRLQVNQVERVQEMRRLILRNLNVKMENMETPGAKGLWMEVQKAVPRVLRTRRGTVVTAIKDRMKGEDLVGDAICCKNV